MNDIDETQFHADDSRLADQNEFEDHDKAPKGFEPDPDALGNPEEPEEWSA